MTTAASSPGDVIVAMSNLEGKCDLLKKALEDLYVRVEMILKPPLPKPDRNDPGVSVEKSKLGTWIDARADDLERVAVGLADICERIQL